MDAGATRAAAPAERRVLDVEGLQALVETLRARGYAVLGPTVRNGAIVHAEISAVDDLPRGWGDEQDGGRYRIRRRDDEALFAFAAPAQSWKHVLFPPRQLLWSGERRDGELTADPAPPTDDPRPYALLGVRSCDLAAISVHDRVLRDRAYADPHYAAQRDGVFVVALTCSDPAGTCFCVSMGTGPSPERIDPGYETTPYDLTLTELYADGPHRFVLTAATARGTEVLADLPSTGATDEDVSAARRVADDAAARMGREMSTTGIKDLLYDNVEHPRWDDVADRCLSCGNCTMVCPTCFCTTVEDVTDLTATHTERHRVWDSCFTADFSQLHGGPVRTTTRSRYRQWMTHKLASWWDQFGTSGCVGCGRCIAWCPVAIDITEEVAAIRGETGQPTTGEQP